ncbi:hypothetical protein THRCLA_11099 [Thraustotheca clavata]|uniref:Rab-GAP TBC domain-containing protein n=1 Tax=Thraustotheca clavata TaxID=74557 RepID=A0A1V9Y8V1_9STRA|nr:hypothetical protein THRCLA_11099 [Thraustotheca clavata]
MADLWINVVKKVNFIDQDERSKVLQLTEPLHDTSLRWSIPEPVAKIHRQVYHQIAEPLHAYSSLIERDVTRTFCIFEPPTPVNYTEREPELFRVLNAVARAEDGYCQGMNFIAAVFLEAGLPEEDAYSTFVYLLHHKYMSQFYKDSSIFLNEYLKQFQARVHELLPELAARLESCGFEVYLYGIEWFTTLFSCSSKIDLTHAVIDLILANVTDVMFRVGIALLKNCEEQLMSMNFDDLLRDFKVITKQVDTYQIICDALTIPPHPGASSYGGILQMTAKQTLPQWWPFVKRCTVSVEWDKAIEFGSVAKICFLWEAWQRTTSKWPLDRRNIANTVIANEALCLAIWYGSIAVGVFALEMGAQVNDPDEWGLRPLHFAVVRNQPDFVRLLWRSGADVNLRGGNSSVIVPQWYMKSPVELVKVWTLSNVEAAEMILSGNVCLDCNTPFHLFNNILKRQCSKCKCFLCPQRCYSAHKCRRNSPTHLIDYMWLYGVPPMAHNVLTDDEGDEDDCSTILSKQRCFSTWYCSIVDCHAKFSLFSKRQQCSICTYYVCRDHLHTKRVQGHDCGVCSCCNAN